MSQSAPRSDPPVPSLIAAGDSVCETINAAGRSAMVLACEHASNHVPQSLDGLGLSRDVLESHVAWDPGARDLAVALSERFDAPLVASKVSRLVYDCNRPPDVPSAVPERSEIYDIPGNSGLGAAEIEARHA
ncbi:MAG TPA: hypothetical protein ENJ68_03355, partial [Devosia sp.]|nr:hypothetical protein [Devosia sp.]